MNVICFDTFKLDQILSTPYPKPMKIYILITLFIVSCSSPQKRVEKTPTGQILTPQTSTNVDLVDHKFFKISYDKQRRLARYVVYQLSADQLRAKSAEREDKFIADPILKSRNIPYVLPNEYVRTGFDRGHLAPSADFTWNQEANDKTFVMSNMAPQSKNLNRDAWRRLEEKVRKWACGEKLVTVITGPVLTAGMPTLPSGLEIPQSFYKIIIDETPPVKTIAFLYHQEDRGDVLAKRMISVDSIEQMTGIAFNQINPNLLQDKIRRPASLNEWHEEDCKN